MDSLIIAAAQALQAGDVLAALQRVALRDDPPALALRGIAMAQLGDLPRARELLRRAARGFGPDEPVARARCVVAEAEIALVSRDLGRAVHALDAARATLTAHGDRQNAAHAGYLAARRLLLIGQLDAAEQALGAVDAAALPLPSRAGFALVAAGIAMRRIRTQAARAALAQATQAAHAAAIPALVAEVERATDLLHAPAARVIRHGETQLLTLEDVEALLASDALIVDACRSVVRAGRVVLPLAGRPVLFALARTLAAAWPGDAPRETLLLHAFRARHADESHRARLRVEIGRLRAAVQPVARLTPTKRGFALAPRAPRPVVVLAPPMEGEHADVLALLADGEAWSSSALALALEVSTRTVQRALETLAQAGKVESFGYGRACRWIAPGLAGFPTSLLLPAPLPKG